MPKSFTYKGETHNYCEWARRLGCSRTSISYWINNGKLDAFEKYYQLKPNPLCPIFYVEQKINMLVNDFYIRLTDEEKRHFYTLTSEYAIDQYAHDLIMKKL